MLKQRRIHEVVLGLAAIAFAISVTPQALLSTAFMKWHQPETINTYYLPATQQLLKDEGELFRNPHHLISTVRAKGSDAVFEQLARHAEDLQVAGQLTEQRYIAIANVARMLNDIGAAEHGFHLGIPREFTNRLRMAGAKVFSPDRVFSNGGDLEPPVVSMKYHLRLPESGGSAWVAALLFLALVFPKYVGFRFAKWSASFTYYGLNGAHACDIITELRLGWRVLLGEMFDSSPWARNLLNGANALHAEARFQGGEYEHYFTFAKAAKQAIDAGRAVPHAVFADGTPIYTRDFTYLASYLADLIRHNMATVRTVSLSLANEFDSLVSGEVVQPLRLAHVVATEVMRNPWQLRNANTRNVFRLALYAASTLFFINLLSRATPVYAGDTIFMQVSAAGRKGKEALFLEYEHVGTVPFTEQPLILDFDHVIGSQAVALEVGSPLPKIFEGISFTPTMIAQASFKNGPELAAVKGGWKLAVTRGDFTVLSPLFFGHALAPKVPDSFFTDTRFIYTPLHFGEGSKYAAGPLVEVYGGFNTQGDGEMDIGPGVFLGFPGGHLRAAVQKGFGDRADGRFKALISGVLPLPW